MATFTFTVEVVKIDHINGDIDVDYDTVDIDAIDLHKAVEQLKEQFSQVGEMQSSVLRNYHHWVEESV
jgi:hypothetical protein